MPIPALPCTALLLPMTLSPQLQIGQQQKIRKGLFEADGGKKESTTAFSEVIVQR